MSKGTIKIKDLTNDGDYITKFERPISDMRRIFESRFAPCELEYSNSVAYLVRDFSYLTDKIKSEGINDNNNQLVHNMINDLKCQKSWAASIILENIIDIMLLSLESFVTDDSSYKIFLRESSVIGYVSVYERAISFGFITK